MEIRIMFADLTSNIPNICNALITQSCVERKHRLKFIIFMSLITNWDSVSHAGKLVLQLKHICIKGVFLQ